VVKFPPLIRCAAAGCEALVEPSIGRCEIHRGKDAPRPSRPPSRKPNLGAQRAAKPRGRGVEGKVQIGLERLPMTAERPVTHPRGNRKGVTPDE
jgi:hypothetical protein